jgi:hypothetical protein
MKRREFITFLGGVAVLSPHATSTQAYEKLPTIGFLGAGTPAVASQWVDAFVTRLAQLGWMDGRTVVIEYRWAEARTERYSEIAAELVAAGKCFLDMLGVFAEFETNLRKERQMEGIAKAKAAGVYKGRPPSVDSVRVAALKGASQIARKLNISRASVYRALGVD